MAVLTPSLAALFGSIATAVAIFGGGLAVEAYRRRRDRDGMALALAGAIEAQLSLIDARGMARELESAVETLERGDRLDFVTTIGDNAPFHAITLAYADRLGNLGGDLPLRVARFLTYNQGLQHDLRRLAESQGTPQMQAALIRQMGPLWEHTRAVGWGVATDLKATAGFGKTERRGPRGLRSRRAPG